MQKRWLAAGDYRMVWEPLDESVQVTKWLREYFVNRGFLEVYTWHE